MKPVDVSNHSARRTNEVKKHGWKEKYRNLEMAILRSNLLTEYRKRNIYDEYAPEHFDGQGGP